MNQFKRGAPHHRPTAFLQGTAIDPQPRIILEKGSKEITMRAMPFVSGFELIQVPRNPERSGGARAASVSTRSQI